MVAAAVDEISDGGAAAELIEPAAGTSSEPVEPTFEDDTPPTESRSEDPEAAASGPTKTCGNLTVAAGSTTCAFAQNVFYEYWTATDRGAGHEDTIEAYSPALERWLSLTCEDGDSVICRGDAGAEVQMPRDALDSYTQDAADAYAADHTVSE